MVFTRKDGIFMGYVSFREGMHVIFFTYVGPRLLLWTQQQFPVNWNAATDVLSLRCVFWYDLTYEYPPCPGHMIQIWLIPKEYIEMFFNKQLGGGFKHFLFSSLYGEDSHFD